MEISKEAIAKVYEDFETSEIKESKDKVIVTSTRINNPGLFFLVMSYGGYAKVISPTDIIGNIVEQAKKIEKNYKR